MENTKYFQESVIGYLENDKFIVSLWKTWCEKKENAFYFSMSYMERSKVNRTIAQVLFVIISIFWSFVTLWWIGVLVAVIMITLSFKIYSPKENLKQLKDFSADIIQLITALQIKDMNDLVMRQHEVQSLFEEEICVRAAYVLEAEGSVKLARVRHEFAAHCTGSELLKHLRSSFEDLHSLGKTFGIARGNGWGYYYEIAKELPLPDVA